MPKLKERFFAVPDGEIHPKWFEAGEFVTGQVAKAAEELGLLQKDENKALEKAPEIAAKVDDDLPRRGRPRKF